MTGQPNIIHLLLKAAEADPSRLAIIQDDHSLSYEELINAIQEESQYLKEKGLKKGDKVLVFVPLSMELYVVVLALFHAGMIPVFIDEWVRFKRLSACCRQVPCKGIITKKIFLPFTYIIPGISSIPVKLSPGKRKNGLNNIPEDVSNTDTALVTFTTGSTGMPKAANRTHEFLHAQFNALKPLLQKQGNCILNTLPIVTLLNLGLGKTTVLPSKGFKVKKPLSLINVITARKEIDSIITSPSIAAALSKTQTDFSHIRHIITGGGAVTPADAIQLEKAFASADITVVYGSTEAEPISHLDIKQIAGATPQMILEKGVPVGRPDGIDLVIMNITNRTPITEMNFLSQQVMTGAPGEILVSGAHVLKEYINNPAATAANKINVNGTIWHRTGDVGRMDASGNLFFLGRCNEIIQWKEQPIFPLIVSTLLRQNVSGIGDTALLLLDDELFILIEEKYSDRKNEIADQLEAMGLAGGRFMFIKSFPRDPRHQTKIDYERLRLTLSK